MHGLLVEELEYDHVEESFGEFCLDFFLIVISHFLVASLCICVVHVYNMSLLRHILRLSIDDKRRYKP